MQLHQYFSYVSRGAHSLLQLRVTEEIAWHLRHDRSEPKSGGLPLSESYFFFFSSYSTFTLFPLKLASSHSLAFCWISRTHRKVLASPFRVASLLQQVCLTSLDRLLPQRLTTGDKQAKNSEKVSEHKWKERISAINLKATAFLSTWPSSQHELQILKI